MSVINQMLVDLEARRAADRPAIQARQTAYVGAGAPRRRRRIPRAASWALLLLVVAAATYASHQVDYRAVLASLERETSSSSAPAARGDSSRSNDKAPSAQRPASVTPPRSNPHPPTSTAQTVLATASPAGIAAIARDHDTTSAPRETEPVERVGHARKRAKAAESKPRTPVAAPAPESKPPQAAIRATDAASSAKVTVAEPAVQVKIVPREPSPEERFARLLADARLALAQGDPGRADSFVQQALRLAPGNPAAAELLLAVQLRRGDTDGAVATLRATLERDPHNVAYAQALARLLAARGDHQLAIDYLRNALAGGRADGQSLALLAGLERRVGDHESAAAHYVDALSQDRTVAVWWLGLGMSLERLQRPAEAHAAFAEAQRLGGLDSEVAAFLKERLAQLNAYAAR